MLFPGGSRGVVLGDFWAPELHEWPGTSCNSGFSVSLSLKSVISSWVRFEKAKLSSTALVVLRLASLTTTYEINIFPYYVASTLGT